MKKPLLLPKIKCIEYVTNDQDATSKEGLYVSLPLSNIKNSKISKRILIILPTNPESHISECFMRDIETGAFYACRGLVCFGEDAALKNGLVFQVFYQSSYTAYPLVRNIFVCDLLASDDYTFCIESISERMHFLKEIFHTRKLPYQLCLPSAAKDLKKNNNNAYEVLEFRTEKKNEFDVDDYKIQFKNFNLKRKEK